MNIVFGSAFRNSAGPPIRRYLDQVYAFKNYVDGDHSVRVIAVEGDSRDQTREDLVHQANKRGISLQLETCNHGGPVFGSTEQPIRMELLSKVGNAIFDAVRPEDNVLIYIENDLVWTPPTMVELASMAAEKRRNFDIFSPLIFAGQAFYDIWAFRKDGRRFSPFPPFHPCLTEDISEVDSVGSCLVMGSDVALNTRIMDGNALVGWCDRARELQYRIGVVSSLRIDHS